MRSTKTFWPVLLLCAAFAQPFAQMRVEKLNRGLIAIRVGSGYYLSWRLLADEPFNTGFNVYHGTTRLNNTPITGATIYTDASRAQITTSAYTVRAVINGTEQAASELAMIINNTDGPNANNQNGETAGYIQINLQRPPTGQHGGTYAPGDGSVGDLDGDGVYEIVLKWDPDNQKDNSQDGTTDNVFIDAYKLDGTRMWRVDLGQNIRAGAHYTQFLVYDFDGDGKAEMIVKTAPGTRDATGQHIRKGPAASANHTASHRNSGGHITAGPEFLTVFNGLTGNEDTTITYLPARDPVSGWGGAGRDNGGNRSQRFNAAVAYLDGERPSAVFQRGYYERMALWALDWRNGRLTQRWMFDSNSSGNSTYSGQGNHQLSVADANADGRHDIITGAAVIRNDGTGMHRTGRGHGDALHVAHMIKGHATPQIFMPHESGGNGVLLRHASNGNTIFHHARDADVGRGVAAELDPARPGFKFWASNSMGLYNIDGTTASSTLPNSINHVIWWDGNLARELLDGYAINRWSIVNNSATRLLTATGYGHINGSKSNPVLQADIFGDWREEVIFSNGSNAIRIYTTTATTTHRLVTMMHDPTYRVAVAWQNSSYNQPPHPGYYIASDMDAGFPLNVAVIGGGVVPPPPQCTPGVDCPGDPCPEGQTGTYPNCTTPPPPAWVYRGNGEYIDSLLLFDLANAAAWSVNYGFSEGARAYGDRDYLMFELPQSRFSEWISTSMQTRTLTSPATMAQFRMKKTGVVYVMYEDRVNPVPAWLAAGGFQVSESILPAINDNQQDRSFTVYSKIAAAGDTIRLGVNTNDGTTQSLMYLVAIGPIMSSSSIRDISAPTQNAMNVIRTRGGSFMVNYSLTDRSSVRIDLFDIKGSRVRTLVNTARAPGVYQEHFSVGGLSAGMYLVKLRAGGTVLQSRIVIAR